MGSFLLSRIPTATNRERGEQKASLASSGNYKVDPTHYLLDGQQRATAIALGFFDIWSPDSINDDGPALCADLADLEPSDSREFAFRVLTRSHPWGYRKDEKKVGKRLSQSAIREAFEAYLENAKQMSSFEVESCSPGTSPLYCLTWPWESEAPVPMPFLIQALCWKEKSPSLYVLERLQNLPFWSSPKWESKRELLTAALDGNSNNEIRIRFNMLLEKLKPLLDPNFGIPGLLVPEPEQSAQTDAEEVTHSDPIETLFIRVNSGGTPLEGEELIYSILKSSWPQAPKLVEKIRHKLVTPPRLVLLASRLVLADMETEHDALPPEPNVARFRQLINNKSNAFESKLHEMLEGSSGEDRISAEKIFSDAASLLIFVHGKSNGTSPDRNNDFRLPPSVAADLVRTKAGSDAMLLLRRT